MTTVLCYFVFWRLYRQQVFVSAESVRQNGTSVPKVMKLIRWFGPFQVGWPILAEEISFDDFKRMDLRVGVVTSVERVRRSEKLYKILVDLGGLGSRQTISSLVGYYEPNELVGKRIVFLLNLKPAKFAGEVSQGMLLAAEIDGKLALLTTDHEIQSGAQVT